MSLPGPTTDRKAPKLVVLRTFLAQTMRDAADNELTLRAQAMAYSLVVSLAPLTAIAAFIGLSEVVTRVVPRSAQVKADLGSLFAGSVGWAGPASSAAAVILALWGAKSLFAEYSQALSRIWNRTEVPRGLRGSIRAHLVSLLLMAVAGIALASSAILGGAFATAFRTLGETVPRAGEIAGLLGRMSAGRLPIDLVFSALLFMTAPLLVAANRPRVRDVASGAVMTAIAYTLGQVALGVYLGSSARLSALGAFGAFLGFLVWAFYTSSIVLWGAQLTYRLAVRRDPSLSHPGADAQSDSASTPSA